MIKAVIREQCSKKSSLHPSYVATALEGFKKVIHGVEFSHSRSLIPSERFTGIASSHKQIGQMAPSVQTGWGGYHVKSCRQWPLKNRTTINDHTFSSSVISFDLKEKIHACLHVANYKSRCSCTASSSKYKWKNCAHVRVQCWVKLQARLTI